MSDVLILNADGTPLSLIPISTIDWHEAIRLLYLDRVKVLKSYDNWVVRSQHLTLHVPSIVIMGEQVKYAKQLKYSRTNVYLRDDFTCQLQTTTLCRDRKGKTKFADLTLDHVIPKSQGGKTNWVNVCTSCKACNSHKGANERIVPVKMPKKPTYYEILSKRKNLPVQIKDEAWADYIGWPPHLVRVIPQPNSPK